MTDLSKIQQVISKEIKEFDIYFKELLKSNAPLLNIITRYVIRKKGKQIRPMFVFLTAKMLGEINHSSRVAAALIEFMHTATLIHDDVVDNSHIRRGFFSINAVWKNKVAVLVGDYLLSKGLLLSVDNKEYSLLDTVSIAVREMAEGELLQIEKARKLDIDEQVYYEIIRKKTAVLIAACCSIGAKSVGSTEDVVNDMWSFGENAGMAFQIKDDIFDYDSNNKTGKPFGNDIREKKLTLPLIYALRNSTITERKKILKTINSNNIENIKIQEVIDFVNSKGGIEYATKIMNDFAGKAIQVLEKFPDNESKSALKSLVNFVVEREK
ncbi:MAG: polyprenyl synthetase family protein [Marinilabiliales bacterium]